MANGIQVDLSGGSSNGIPVTLSDPADRLTDPTVSSGPNAALLNGPGPTNHGFLHFNDLTNAIGLGGAAHDVANVVGTSTHDLGNILINGPAGAVKFVNEGVHHPIRAAQDFGKSVAYDFTPDRLLHHPVYALLDATAGLDFGASLAGRAALVGKIAERAGAPAAELTDAATAKSLGREAEYNRSINPVTERQVPVGQQIGKALLRGPAKQQRMLVNPAGDYLKDATPVPLALGDYAKSFTWRQTQKLIDRAHVAFPEARLPVLGSVFPRAFGAQADRWKVAERSALTYKRNQLIQPAAQLKLAGRRLSLPQQVAIRVVGEGASIPDRIAYHEKEIAEGGLNPKQLKESKAQLLLLQKAQGYIHMGEVGGSMTPLIKPQYEDLASIVDRSRQLAHQREGLLGGVLHDANAINRKLGPLRKILGHELPEVPKAIQNKITRLKALDGGSGSHAEAIAKLEEQLKVAKVWEENPHFLAPPTHLLKEEAPAAAPAAEDATKPPIPQPLSEEYLNHLFRVPYATKPAFRSILGGSSRYLGGRNAPPSTVSNPFRGGYLKHGGGRNDVINLLAESYSEAARFEILRQARQRILQISVRDPRVLEERGVKQHDIVAINTDALGRVAQSDAMRQWRADSYGGQMPEESMTADEAQAIGQQYDALRQEIFKDFSDTVRDDPGYVFADRRLLGGLDEPNPLAGINAREGGRTGISFVDGLNNAVKAAVLYLKPAYLFPNWLGNVALGLVHQGFAAPTNLLRASRLEHYISKDAVGALDSLMGGGVANVLTPQKDLGVVGKLAEKGNKAGEFYASGNLTFKGKTRHIFPGIDDPSRRAAFYHEAQNAGFSTPHEVEQLLTDPKFGDQAMTIAQRAAKEIIDYEDLSPVEQSIIRRVIFFYPWVKGASRYAIHFAQEHPTASFVNAQFAKKGEDWQKEVFGKLPAFAEGLIPFGSKTNNGNPYGINPSSASILETPGQLVEAFHNLFSGHPDKDLNLLQNLAPFESAVFTAASGNAVSGPNSPHQTIAERALGQLYGGLPLFTDLQGAITPPADTRIYPGAVGNFHGIPIQDLIEASRFLGLGGGTPRPYNPIAGQASAARATSGF